MCSGTARSREWWREDAIDFVKEINSMRALRENVAEGRVWASSLGLRTDDIRKASPSLSNPKQRSVSTSRHRTDNALDSLDEIIRQYFIKLAIPTQSLSQLLVLLGKKNGGSRTIAILHITYRLTMRLLSAPISQRDVKFAGKWDYALKGN